MKIWPPLYCRDSKEKVRTWFVRQEGPSYRITSGLLEGKQVTTDPTVCKGKNVGKANETSPIEQATKEIEALYRKQIEQNYFEDISEIDNYWLEPQLAKVYKDYPDYLDFSKGVIIDHKLNGVCCLATAKGCFTRKNKQFFTIPHIEQALKPIFEAFPHAYLHGELFNPDLVRNLGDLVEIVSVTRKLKDVTPELLEKSRKIVQFHLYDGYNFASVKQDSTTYGRKNGLTQLVKDLNSPYIKITPWCVSASMEEAEDIYRKYVKIGGEGIILRKFGAPYQHKRTKDLLKYKKQETEEFEVVELEEGDGNWKGKAKAAVCKLPNGTTFKTNLEGDQAKQAKAWKNRNSYRGKMITVRFQEYSPDGVPLIPYSDLTVRDYE